MARVVGLDLGAYSAKLVLLDSTMRAYRVISIHELPRGETDSFVRAVSDLIGNLGHIDSISVALPGPAVVTHALTLPFSDPKRLDATIPFEIESQLPFDLSDAVFDYFVSTVSKNGTSEVLVGVVRKADLHQFLDGLKSAGIDPRMVLHPALVYQRFFKSNDLLPNTSPGEVSAIVDIGYERTNVAIGKATEGVVFARTFGGGGKDLNNALAQEFKVSPAEANRWKEDSGALGALAAGPDAARASAVLTRALQPMVRELRQSMKSVAARSHLEVQRTYLCGGGALLPGMAEHIRKELGLATEVLRPPAPGDGSSELDPRYAQALSLALSAHLPNTRGAKFNFRRGEFAFKGDFDYLRDKLPRLVAFAAVLLLLFIGSAVLRNSLLAGRERTVDAQLCETTQKILGRCEKNYDRALNMLQGRESPSAAIPKLSAANLLAEFTQRIPTDIPLTFDRLNINLDRIEARGQTDSSKQIDRITSALKGFKCFREVREGKVEKTRDGSKVDFQLDVQVECADENRPPQG